MSVSKPSLMARLALLNEIGAACKLCKSYKDVLQFLHGMYSAADIHHDPLSANVRCQAFEALNSERPVAKVHRAWCAQLCVLLHTMAAYCVTGVAYSHRQH